MVNTSPIWQSREKARQLIDRRAVSKTLSRKWTYSIVRKISEVGAILPPPFGKISKLLPKLFSADLVISSLREPGAAEPLDGFQILTHRNNMDPVFQNGLMLCFTFTHNGAGNEPITVERLELFLRSFAPGTDQYYEYLPSGDAIFGAGPVKPLRFMVQVGRDGPRRARFVVDRAKNEVAEAYSSNFFDLDNEFVLAVSRDKAEYLRIILTTSETGLYELFFVFSYRVGDRKLRVSVSEPIYVYKISFSQ